MGCGSAKISHTAAAAGSSGNRSGGCNAFAEEPTPVYTESKQRRSSKTSKGSKKSKKSKDGSSGKKQRQSQADSRHLSQPDLSTRTSISGNSKIRVTLSKDGSLLEVETETLDPRWVQDSMWSGSGGRGGRSDQDAAEPQPSTSRASYHHPSSDGYHTGGVFTNRVHTMVDHHNDLDSDGARSSILYKQRSHSSMPNIKQYCSGNVGLALSAGDSGSSRRSQPREIQKPVGCCCCCRSSQGISKAAGDGGVSPQRSGKSKSKVSRRLKHSQSQQESCCKSVGETGNDCECDHHHHHQNQNQNQRRPGSVTRIAPQVDVLTPVESFIENSHVPVTGSRVGSISSLHRSTSSNCSCSCSCCCCGNSGKSTHCCPGKPHCASKDTALAASDSGGCDRFPQVVNEVFTANEALEHARGKHSEPRHVIDKVPLGCSAHNSIDGHDIGGEEEEAPTPPGACYDPTLSFAQCSANGTTSKLAHHSTNGANSFANPSSVSSEPRRPRFGRSCSSGDDAGARTNSVQSNNTQETSLSRENSRSSSASVNLYQHYQHHQPYHHHYHHRGSNSNGFSNFSRESSLSSEYSSLSTHSTIPELMRWNSDASHCSLRSLSSERSSLTKRRIGHQTKEQIVELGRMVANPVEHFVQYEIELRTCDENDFEEGYFEAIDPSNVVDVHVHTDFYNGVTVEGGGKKYTQTVERAFHISMAALEPVSSNKKDDKDNFVSVMVQHDKAEFLICTLQPGHLYNQVLDLNFTEGEEVTFFLNGKGVVHLTGYLVEDEEEGEMEDDESEDSDYEPPDLMAIGDDESDSGPSDEEEFEAISGKRKMPDSSSKKKKKKKQKMEVEVEDSDEDEEDDDEDFDSANFLDMEAVEDNEWMDDDDEDDDEDDDDEDEDEDELSFDNIFAEKKDKAKKQQKKEKGSPAGKTQDQTPSKQQGQPTQNGDTTEKKKKKKKKKKNKNKGDETPGSTPQQSPANSEATPKQKSQSQTPGGSKKPKKQVLEGGLIVEELKEGHGPEAKNGKMVQAYYKGTLHQSGKVFDSNLTGKPFKFKLGKKEVITGWDLGFKGMKVGGKRRLVVPPKLGYGGQRAGSIPPNSTLVFDVELKAVS